MRHALITGVNGQDGILLSRLLVKAGYQVIGIGSQSLRSSHLPEEINYISCDIRDTETLLSICDDFPLDEFYNLASISSVAESFRNPDLTNEVNNLSVARILSGLFENQRHEFLKFFQASSSEMFGIAVSEPQNENSPFRPVSPYATSKSLALEECRKFRQRGFFISSNIMYNHESIYRPETFVTRKVTKTIAEISKGKSEKLQVGNIDAERDWGFAGDFVRAAYLSMQATRAEDYIVATGVTHSVRDLIRFALDEVGLSGRELEIIEINETLLRPREINRLVGDASKAQQSLGWKPSKTFEEMIREMVAYDLRN